MSLPFNFAGQSFRCEKEEEKENKEEMIFTFSHNVTIG
jgi:hypothetical protein